MSPDCCRDFFIFLTQEVKEMALPKPNEEESESDFMDRCLSDEMMMDEYPDQDQRIAVCEQQMGKSAHGEIERKFFAGVELKADKHGSFVARIATLNVRDKDGDVTLPGAFPDGKTILISAYMHGSWMGELPVGKGVIRERGAEILLEGEFNLSSESGREHYETVKFAPELQEWSYGFQVEDFELDAEFEGHRVSRILKKLDVFEASPVLRGAVMGTSTLAIKSRDDRDKSEKDSGIPYADQAEAALAAVEQLVERTRSLA